MRKDCERVRCLSIDTKSCNYYKYRRLGWVIGHIPQHSRRGGGMTYHAHFRLIANISLIQVGLSVHPRFHHTQQFHDHQPVLPHTWNADSHFVDILIVVSFQALDHA